VIKTLVNNSLSDNFDDAKTEWDFTSFIELDSNEFVDHCEICNHLLHKYNCLIENKNNGIKLKIGSECIKRFVLINGVKTQEEAALFITNKEKEITKEFEVAGYYSEIILNPLPKSRSLGRFKRLLASLLESRGLTHYSNSDVGCKWVIENILRHKEPTDKEVDKLFLIFNEPKSVPVQRENKRWNDYNKYKEGHTWDKRGKVTATTLVDSIAYKYGFKK
jgi:hypothetical protein